ncbi:MAG: hypothetical protein MJ117_00470 [Lachnospiraceae bacterium]|nr:hypothetical protein [Lachnospiraceae bacterium]
MQKKEKFTVYNHNLVYGNNQLAIKKFIALSRTDGTLQFTNFHRYVANPDRKVKKFNENTNNRPVFVCKFLNYAFFTKGISSLSDLTVDIGNDFLNAYGMHELPDDDEYVRRSRETVKRCVDVIRDFYINLANDKRSGCRIKPDDLYTRRPARNKQGRAYEKKVPVFNVEYIENVKAPIYRDMPNKAFSLLLDHIAENHTDLLGLVALQAFAGLRPSEACNVRRMDSPLGPGIMMKESMGRLAGVTIDLREELNLRSDLLHVGSIKKERTAKVPDIFLKAFRETYDLYMKYMEGRPYEAEYGAFSVNKQGRAITYNNYYSRFRSIISGEMIPIYLNSGDEELVLYGQTLMENSLSPHVFRHWYTCQLVLSGINEPGVLMDYRGDTSPESALSYINAKGELEKEYSRVTNETFNYVMWAARKKNNERP